MAAISACRPTDSIPVLQGELHAIGDPINGTAVECGLSRRTQCSGAGQGKAGAEEQTGIKIGEHAPEFTLKDQEGKKRSLDDLLKKGKVALVFYRSADW